MDLMPCHHTAASPVTSIDRPRRALSSPTRAHSLYDSIASIKLSSESSGAPLKRALHSAKFPRWRAGVDAAAGEGAAAGIGDDDSRLDSCERTRSRRRSNAVV